MTAHEANVWRRVWKFTSSRLAVVTALLATGRGVDEHFGLASNDVDIWTASLAKPIPSNGGLPR
jgi:hypothetical protein